MALASSVRERLETDYGLALGAFPDPMQSSRDKFFVGLATRAQTTVAGRRYAGHPDILKTRAAKQALDLLRLHLLKLGT